VRLPAGNALACPFLAVFVALRHWGAIRAYIAALLAWLLLAVVLEHLSIDLAVSMAIAAVIFAATVPYFQRLPHQSLRRIPATARVLSARVAVTGCVVGMVVVISRLAGPVWGGLAAVFPGATTGTIMVVTWHHGAAAMGSLARTWSLGVVCNSLFLVGVALITPAAGPVVGIVGGYLIAVCTAVALHK
jgi:hypothetical protein